MRIFLATLPSPQCPVSETARGMAQGLEAIGHEVVSYPPAPAQSSAEAGADSTPASIPAPFTDPSPASLLAALKSASDQKKPDLALFVGTGWLTPELASECKRRHLRTLIYTPASEILPSPERLQQLAMLFDTVWAGSPLAARAWQAAGVNARLVPPASDPRLFHPIEASTAYEISHVGSPTELAAAGAKGLMEKSYNIDVFGSEWTTQREPTGLKGMLATTWKWFIYTMGSTPEIQGVPRKHLHPTPTPAEAALIYARTKINLAFNPPGLQPDELLLPSDFDVPMAGGLYLCEFRQSLALHYKVGEEIDCFRDAAELVEKVQYYLARPREFEAVRLAGYERARGNHTWQARLQGPIRGLL